MSRSMSRTMSFEHALPIEILATMSSCSKRHIRRARKNNKNKRRNRRKNNTMGNAEESIQDPYATPPVSPSSTFYVRSSASNNASASGTNNENTFSVSDRAPRTIFVESVGHSERRNTKEKNPASVVLSSGQVIPALSTEKFSSTENTPPSKDKAPDSNEHDSNSRQIPSTIPNHDETTPSYRSTKHGSMVTQQTSHPARSTVNQSAVTAATTAPKRILQNTKHSTNARSENASLGSEPPTPPLQQTLRTQPPQSPQMTELHNSSNNASAQRARESFQHFLFGLWTKFASLGSLLRSTNDAASTTPNHSPPSATSFPPLQHISEMLGTEPPRPKYTGNKPSVAYQAVSAMWDGGEIVLRSIRLRRGEADDAARDALVEFFTPFLRFTAAFLEACPSEGGHEALEITAQSSSIRCST